MKPIPVTTRYSLAARLPRPYKIALLSDLHDQNGQEILTILQREQPDLICIAGDLSDLHYYMDHSSEDQAEYEFYYLHNASPLQKGLNRLLHLFYDLLEQPSLPETTTYSGLDFLRSALEIAPVCYSTGNHEWYLQEEDRREIRATGAFLLENQDVEPLPGLRVGGLPTRHDVAWLERFCAKDGYKLLLCHHPEYYKWLIQGHSERTPDLICSGHAHGGQWRFFGRGVYAPGQGFFPKYTHGLYDGVLLVSSGCANTSRFPRFGNPPEVVILQLNP